MPKPTPESKKQTKRKTPKTHSQQTPENTKKHRRFLPILSKSRKWTRSHFKQAHRENEFPKQIGNGMVYQETGGYACTYLTLYGPEPKKPAE